MPHDDFHHGSEHHAGEGDTGTKPAEPEAKPVTFTRSSFTLRPGRGVQPRPFPASLALFSRIVVWLFGWLMFLRLEADALTPAIGNAVAFVLMAGYIVAERLSSRAAARRSSSGASSPPRRAAACGCPS